MESTFFTYKYIDWLPTVPLELLTYADEPRVPLKKDSKEVKFSNRQFIQNGKTQFSVNYNVNQIQRKELEDWLDQNITNEYLDKRVAHTSGNSSIHWPHVDPFRNYALNYILDSGGDNVITSFYQEQGYPFLRPELVQGQDKYKIDYDNLVLVDSVRLMPNRWHLLSVKCIHGVENLASSRISIQLSLDNPGKFN
jgi:hypothetical protein